MNFTVILRGGKEVACRVPDRDTFEAFLQVWEGRRAKIVSLNKSQYSASESGYALGRAVHFRVDAIEAVLESA
jgi:hypothetical protein